MPETIDTKPATVLDCGRCGIVIPHITQVRTWDKEIVMSVNGLVPYDFFRPVCVPCYEAE